MLHLELKTGTVIIRTRPDLAPNHVARIEALARQGFYDGLAFHRVIDGFMAQTGCPLGTGTGGSGTKIKAEFSDAHHARGVCSMARTPDPDSADSQFFIMLKAADYLDGQYTVWGEVAEGMEHVDAIKKGSRARNGAVEDPDRILRMTVVDDA
ncbi:MAG: peptidylprolyl isomerase [Thalassobaculales bacterium]